MKNNEPKNIIANQRYQHEENEKYGTVIKHKILQLEKSAIEKTKKQYPHLSMEK